MSQKSTLRNTTVSQVPSITPRFNDLLGGLSKELPSWLQVIIAEEQKARSDDTEGMWGETQRYRLSLRVLSQCSHTGCAWFLQQQDMIIHVKYCLPRRLIRDLVPRVLPGGWSHRHSLPRLFQNSRCPEGKRVSSINHILCTNTLDTVRRSNQSGNAENVPKFQFPRHQPNANLQAGPSFHG